jgi:hypothetical protein
MRSMIFREGGMTNVLSRPFCFPGMEEPPAGRYFASIQTIFDVENRAVESQRRFQC